MKRYRVESMEVWISFKERLVDEGYMLWQTQYGWDTPEGYIVGFMKGEKQLEIVTHNKDIAKDIIVSRL